MKKTIFTLLIFFIGITASASNFTVNNLNYNILSSADMTVEVTLNPNYVGDLIVPETVKFNNKSYKVVAIGDKAFLNNEKITSAIIPNTVKLIGKESFSRCLRLDFITLGTGVETIADRAFALTGFDVINILNPVAPIGAHFESYVCELAILNIPLGALSSYSTTAGWKDFLNINESISVGGINYKISSHSTVEVIPGVIKYSGHITIPQSIVYKRVNYTVTSIGKKAFCWCLKLLSVKLPNTIISIGERAFLICPELTSINIPSEVSIINSHSFANCVKLKNIILPKGIKSIYPNAFYNCNMLESIILPDGLTFIGQSSFSNCKKLTSIVIPNTVTEINENTFDSCESLSTLTLGYKVSFLWHRAFIGCHNLTTINALNPKAPFFVGFDSATTGIATLNIPIGSMQSYIEQGWNVFKNIQEVFAGENDVITDEPKIEISGNEITISGAPSNCQVELYNTNGQQLYSGTATTITTPTSGIYIVCIAGKPHKIVIN